MNLNLIWRTVPACTVMAVTALSFGCSHRAADNPAQTPPGPAVSLVPTLSGFTPVQGTGGTVNTVVTLTGTNFTGAATVSFNGVPDPAFTVLSPTTIVASVPLGATTGSITVLTPGGTAVSATPFTVRFGAELIVRSSENLSSHAAVLALVQGAVANHVQTLVIAAKQDEDDEFASGTVFYNSSLAPAAFPGFDALQDVLTEAHKAGLLVKAWMPQFHDQVAFQKNAAWAMQALVGGSVVDYTGSVDANGNPVTDFFVNPCSPDVQAYELALVKELVTNYAIDGLVLDWLRYDGWNMDMSPASIAAFQTVYPGEDPTALDFTNTDLTTNTGLAHWQTWRTGQLGTYVAGLRTAVKAIKPNLPLGVFILPPEFVEVGQDAAQFKASLDFISPMCYLEDWGDTPDWVYNTCIAQTLAKVGPGVEIVPALDCYLDAQPSDPTAGFVTSEQYWAVNAGIRSQVSGVKTLNYFLYGTWTQPTLNRVDALRQF